MCARSSRIPRSQNFGRRFATFTRRIALRHSGSRFSTTLYLQTDLGPLDVLGSIAGIENFSALRSNAVSLNLFGRQVLVISIEDLIKAKETLGRSKDLLVATELRAILEKSKDNPPRST